jgi:hypothetical protein
MTKDLNIIIEILEAMEAQSTNVRGARGYGPGTHPHFGTDTPRPLGNRTNLGKSRYDEEEEKEPTEDTQVKISRAFKNDE